MAVAKDKGFIKSAVYIVQDNMFLKQMVTQMVRFISDNGIMPFSTEKRTQYQMVRNYFRALTIETLTQRGFNMGVGTPWGDEVSELVAEEDDLDFGEEDEDS